MDLTNHPEPAQTVLSLLSACVKTSEFEDISPLIEQRPDNPQFTVDTEQREDGKSLTVSVMASAHTPSVYAEIVYGCQFQYPDRTEQLPEEQVRALTIDVALPNTYPYIRQMMHLITNDILFDSPSLSMLIPKFSATPEEAPPADSRG